MANKPTQATLCELGIQNEAYYAEATQYLGIYIWGIEDHFPQSDARLWEMPDRDAAE